ncbi:MAG TPA: hypothetical protein VH877_09230 [Polyangia bacterium]|nr:hypothetical protein [Polyangia bacterium]
MTEHHKEEKLLRAIATPPVELPEESEVDESAEWTAVPPLEPALRERLRAAVRAELAKDAASEPEVAPQKAQGRQAQAVTQMRGDAVPNSPRYRAPARRWWRPRLWLAAIGVVAAVATVLLMGPWRGMASVANYKLAVVEAEEEEHSGMLGSPLSDSQDDAGEEDISLPLERAVSAWLQPEEAVSQMPEVKVWIEQQGRLLSCPVSVKLLPQAGPGVLLLRSDKPLAELSSEGAKLSAGPAALLVAVGVHGKLPSDPEIVAWVGKEKPPSRSWRLIQQPVTIVTKGQ